MLQGWLKYRCLLLLLGLMMLSSALYLPTPRFSSSPALSLSSASHSEFSSSISSSVSSSKMTRPSATKFNRHRRSTYDSSLQSLPFSSSSTPLSSLFLLPRSKVSSPTSNSSALSSWSSQRGRVISKKQLPTGQGRELHRSRRVKRSQSRYWNNLRKVMARHRRYRNQQAVIEKMFKTFDMNKDQVIERDEFRAILQLLGVGGVRSSLSPFAEWCGHDGVRSLNHIVLSGSSRVEFDPHYLILLSGSGMTVFDAHSVILLSGAGMTAFDAHNVILLSGADMTAFDAHSVILLIGAGMAAFDAHNVIVLSGAGMTAFDVHSGIVLSGAGITAFDAHNVIVLCGAGMRRLMLTMSLCCVVRA
ncbi:orcokinin peptides type b [Plakobranchus ocellatus]|uniref:Orcokinin peptides type b n=1 Tax=Plakobranchus ocellatus TaxID=259542 RepID=A0AAV4BN92_9GAST|nr:orcokinin peptides type b [Plakobranchus ocellatus]